MICCDFAVRRFVVSLGLRRFARILAAAFLRL
jgi:hypothetical protein